MKVSMKKYSFELCLAICLFMSPLCTFAQPEVQWNKTYGATSNDAIVLTVATVDGGYLLAGRSSSGQGFDKTEGSRGDIDYWIVKVDAQGNKEWDKTYGGSETDNLNSAEQTLDGGYIIGGFSDSPKSGDKSENPKGPKVGTFLDTDFWILKLKPDGSKEWDRTIGSHDFDNFINAHQVSDGGFVIVGSTRGGISGDKTAQRLGPTNGWDNWIIKVSKDGNILWDKASGTSQNDRVTCSTVLKSGEILIGSAQGLGDLDKFNIAKLDVNGHQLWYKRIGNDSYAEIASVKEAPHDTYVLGGLIQGDTISGDQTEAASGRDYWVVKTDSSGSKIWDRTIGTIETADGSAGDDKITNMMISQDGSIYAIGVTNTRLASKDKTEIGYGDLDSWLVKLDSAGRMLWNKIIGGSGYDYLDGICSATDGGFVLTGGSDSPPNIFKSEPDKGEYDYWILKMKEESSIPVVLRSISVVKEGNASLISWQTTFETRSDHFDVEYSLNAKAWTTIATLNASGKSNVLQSYQFVHSNPQNGNNYYRLKMVDTDGTYAYSSIEQVMFNFDFHVSVYPNPVTETIHFKADDWSQIKGLQILNCQGKVFYNAGNKPSQHINARSLRPGLYFIKVSLTDGTEAIRKIAVGH